MRSLTTLTLFLLLLLTVGQSLYAQETSSTLNGVVTDSKGAPVIGATVSIKYLPTGYETRTQSNNKGIFVVPNLHPGGPYTIKVSFVGLQEDTLNDINLTLGNNPDVVISLSSASNELREVVVGAGRRGAGSGLTVSTRQLSTLPTLGRSLQDFTRLTPQSNNNSFAGTKLPL
jgi:hypothetical protein